MSSTPTTTPPPRSLRQNISRFAFITIGTLVGAASVIIFMAPFDIAPGGITGVGIILNVLIGAPIGAVVFIGNIPIQYLAYRMLGGWRTVAWTLYVVTLYSFAIDFMTPLFPTGGISEDVLLNALFGGIIGGVGAGLIYRGGGTFGGTSTVARILQEKYGTPLSSTYLYANMGIVVLAGITLGWEGALYATVVLVMEGAASDYVMEGPSVIRTATIITDHPEAVSTAVLYQMRRGVTGWEATGMFTGQKRHILFVSFGRSQVNTLREIVLDADPAAFIVIGHGHVAYGQGFRRRVPKGNGILKAPPLNDAGGENKSLKS